ncbi:alpha/beta hydrolase [Actinokineospora sp. PR83]|uniref:alpha/beta hydrolase n=1 Tax=Actinokineospora sp. PR83 TaxID=2884908 RepID=UPI001F2C08F4|nr:alpha/beta hydrolase [Actinokineospora sp. PR83]MCG8916480.1 alpha/beta hydrolase [Actinokineospora sp. PR83]
MPRHILGAAVLAAALILGATPAQAAPVDPLRLPEPTGRHHIGVTTLHLVDHARVDPWPDAVGSRRELVVSVFYPATTVRDHPPAPHMGPGTAAGFGAVAPFYLPGIPASGVDWAATRTHAHTDAPARAVRAPVVLYSPGLADPRSLGTAVAEELAGQGSVVVTVDHPGETSVVEFPDGRVRTIALPGDPRTSPALYRSLVDTRLADTRFVLDQVESLARGHNPDAEGHPLPPGLGRALDIRHLSIYGQGLGGTTATEALHEDPRLDAAVNLDGYLDYLPDPAGTPGDLLPAARDGVTKPLLLVGSEGFRDERLDRSWSALLAHHGPATRTQVDGVAHWGLTDLGALVPQLQARGLVTAADRDRLVGSLPPRRSVPLLRGHVVGFLARWTGC